MMLNVIFDAILTPKHQYQSALGGLTGPMGTQMPPRGGNDRLDNDQVRAAVDYMLALVKSKE